MRRRWSLAVVVGVLLAVVGLAGCGGDDDAEPASPAPTRSATLPGTVLATAAAPRTPTVRPTNTATPTGTLTATPTRTPTPADRPPVINWLIREHSGAGVVTVRLETNVPTTAMVRVVGKPGETPGVEPQASAGRSLAHVVSIPLPAETFIEVEVKGDNGTTTTGQLEGGATVVGGQFWGRAEYFPKVTFAAGFRGSVTWGNLRDPDAPRRVAGVQLFDRPAGCTTAQACRYSPGKAFRDDAIRVEETLERHTIPVAFEVRNADYLILIQAPGAGEGGRAVQRFFQIEVKADELTR
ncbi:MAG: hypothetical protein ACKVVT_07440 [Dehalococcoidia bacterium]